MSFLGKLFGKGVPSVAGLDIGTLSLKFVQMAQMPEGLRLVKLATRPTPPMAVKDGTVIDADALAAEVKQLVLEQNVQAKKIVSAVAGQSVVIRPISMTIMTEKELKNSIRYEAERYLPYSVVEAQIEGAILRKPIPGDERQMEVLLMAAPKEMVTNAQKVISGADLQVEAIELEPLALLRILQITLDPDSQRQTLALVNLGASFTSINIFKEGILRHNRTVTVAGNSFTKAIGGAMNLSFEDAEKLKKEKGSIRIEKDGTPVAPTTMRIFNVILPVLTELVTEIQRSFDYYRSRYKGETVDMIYLAGGTANFKNLDRYLSGELGVRVEVFDPLRKVGLTGETRLSSEEMEGLAPALSVVVGLAARPLV